MDLITFCYVYLSAGLVYYGLCLLILLLWARLDPDDAKHFVSTLAHPTFVLVTVMGWPYYLSLMCLEICRNFKGPS